jgi:hypothetical protein
MQRFFTAQRAPSGARIFSVQAGDVELATPLTVEPRLVSSTTTMTGGVVEAFVLVDLPAPRERCIILDHQNRTIRL